MSYQRGFSISPFGNPGKRPWLSYLLTDKSIEKGYFREHFGNIFLTMTDTFIYLKESFIDY